MIKIIVAYALLFLSFQQMVPIAVSSPESTFSEPGHFPTELIIWNPVMGDLYMGANYSSKWIQSKDWHYPTTVNFHTVFYASCNGPVILHITAFGGFKARLNGGQEMTGYGENHIFDFTLTNLKCGENTLVVTVHILNTNLPALIFAIVQDQQGCYKCSSEREHWDNNRCKCACNDLGNCHSSFGPMVWSGYPTCACKCKNILSCPEDQYFDTNFCVCKCKEVHCYAGYFQDAFSCQCLMISGLCPYPVDCVGLKSYSF